MQYKYFLAILGLAVIAGLAGVGSAEAQGGEGVQPLIQKLAQRFNLQEADVQAVFDEAKTERQTEMKKKFDNRLDEAVMTDDLTETQKQLILAKRAELKHDFDSKREGFKNMTPDERKAAMKQHHRELKAWAEANNIDFKYLIPRPMGGSHHGHGSDFRPQPEVG